MKPIKYKKHWIYPTLNGWYDVYVNGRFYKSDTVKGAKAWVNRLLDEEGKL